MTAARFRRSGTLRDWLFLGIVEYATVHPLLNRNGTSIGCNMAPSYRQHFAGTQARKEREMQNHLLTELNGSTASSTSSAVITGQAPFFAFFGVYRALAGFVGITLSATANSQIELRSHRR